MRIDKRLGSIPGKPHSGWKSKGYGRLVPGITSEPMRSVVRLKHMPKACRLEWSVKIKEDFFANLLMAGSKAAFFII